MKTLLLAFLLSSNAFAQTNACPNLSGSFYCLTTVNSREPKLDVLTITQQTGSDKVTTYEFQWKNIGGSASITRADEFGIADEWGWWSLCKDQSLISVSQDGRFESTLHLEGNDLVRRDNGREALRCHRKVK